MNSDVGRFARRVPQRWRTLHRLYAVTFGYFWNPCPICGQEFGGHEWTFAHGWAAISRRTADFNQVGICPACARAGKGRHRTPPNVP